MSEFGVNAWSEVWNEERRALGFDPLIVGPPLEPKGKSVHAAPHPQGTALCLSGGGIRSATFALGVLQGLALRNRLRNVDYLSTVSGGGYIGSWLSALLARHEGRLGSPLTEVEAELRRIALHQTAATEDERVRQNQSNAYRAVTWLREFSNYLTPRLGIGSLDTWTVFAIYIRNLLVNWSLFVPMLLLALSLPRAAVWVLEQRAASGYPPWVLIAWVLTPLFTAAAVLIGWPALADGRNPEDRRNRSPRVLLLVVLAAVVTAVEWGLTSRGTNSGASAFEMRSADGPTALAAGMVLVLPTSVAWLFSVAIVIGRRRKRYLPWLGWGAALVLAASMVTWFTRWRTRPVEEADRAFVVALATVWTCLVALVAHEVRRRTPARHGKRRRRPLWRLVSLAHWLRRDRGQRASRLAHEAVWRVAKRGAALLLSALVLSYATCFVLTWLYVLLMSSPAMYVCAAFPATLGVYFAITCVYPALTSTLSGKWEEEDREWWGRMGGWMLMCAVAWAALAAVSLYGPELFRLPYGELLAPIGGVSGAVTLLLARSGLTGATDEKARAGGSRGWPHRLVLTLAAPVFVVIALCAFSLGLERLIERFEAWMLWLLPAVAAVQVMININKFSSHAFYRHRLVRSYLAASRAASRSPHPFTGFDADDNLPMYALRSPRLTAANIPDAAELRARIARERRTSALSGALDAALRHRLVGTGPLAMATALEQILSTPGLLPFCQEYRAADWQHEHRPRDQRAGLLRHAPSVVVAYIEARSLPADVWSGIEREWTKEGATGYMARRRLLEWSYPGLVLPGTQRPMLVINAALNLTARTRLAWQERKARSFVFTPLYCGAAEDDAGSYGVPQAAPRRIIRWRFSPPWPRRESVTDGLGFRRSRLYGGSDGVTVGTAVTISGAAVNSNMGYHTSRTISFLMTMFNVRLGAWLGNPGEAGGSDPVTAPYRRAHPRLAMLPLTREALIGTSASNPYVHLSDGGHFENLGLFEMLRRRCETIYVCDAGCDPLFEFDDLGNAIRKARSDLGVEIDIDVSSLYAETTEHGQVRRRSVRHWTTGTATYPEGKKATLFYIKPTLVGDGEPQDVLNYAARNPAFPHQTTGDQFFSESQFESYRALGEHIGSLLPVLR